MAFQSVLLCRDPKTGHKARRFIESLRIGAEVCAPSGEASEFLQIGKYDAVIVAGADEHEARSLFQRMNPAGSIPVAFAILAASPEAELANAPGDDRVLTAEEIPALLGGELPRRYHRHRLHSLAYVRLNGTNGGIIRDLSEGGMAVQAVTPLQIGDPVHFSFELMNPRCRIEAEAQVAWADAYGQAGLAFRDIPPRPARQLKDWLLVNLLSLAHEAHVADAAVPQARHSVSPVLATSGIALPAVRIERPQEAVAEIEEVSVPWWPYAVSSRSLAIFTDALAVLCAVLLFTVVFIVTSKQVPSWPLFALLATGTFAFFAFVYRYWFLMCPGGTPGTQLALLATETSEAEIN
jgi:PilZ domain-containing protein